MVALSTEEDGRSVLKGCSRRGKRAEVNQQKPSISQFCTSMHSQPLLLVCLPYRNLRLSRSLFLHKHGRHMLYS